jgi:Cytochrome P460
MKLTLLTLGATILTGLFASSAHSQGARAVPPSSTASAPISNGTKSPIFGVTVPVGYRKWELIAPSHRPDFGELRAVLGNEVSMNAYRAGTLPFPDGAVLAKLAWKHVPSAEVSAAFVPGGATTLQVMVKDSKKYASTGGWGFGRFIGGKPVDAAQHQTCFACHQALVKNHDFVFTRFAP